MNEPILTYEDCVQALASYESQLRDAQPGSPEHHFFSTMRTFVWLNAEAFQALLASKYAPRED